MTADCPVNGGTPRKAREQRGKAGRGATLPHTPAVPMVQPSTRHASGQAPAVFICQPHCAPDSLRLRHEIVLRSFGRCRIF